MNDKIKNQKSKIFIGAVFTVAVITVIAIWPNNKNSNQDLTAFAQCLAEKKITMYGAEWCPHCLNEKKAFGDSFKYVPYVECPEEPNRCLAAGIRGYPTWLMADGKKLEGEQGINRLSAESGCFLPE